MESTKNTTNEKIRTGQSFLYRRKGLESMVIEIKLVESIDQERLQKAMDQSFRRYWYLTQKFSQINGDFYLVNNDQPVRLRKSSQLLPLGGKEVNEHLIDINYLDNVIFISYHHGLCDGRGIMPFVRTLLFEYFAKKKFEGKPDSVRVSKTHLLEGELKEPGLVELSEVSDGLPFPSGNEHVLPEVDGLSERPEFTYLSQIKIDSQAFIKYAKSIDATPAIALALNFSKAIASMKPESENAVICNLVVDLRSGVDLENTYRNCVSTLKLELDPSKRTLETARYYRAKLAAFKMKDNLQRELQKIIGLSNQLDKLPSYKEKQEALSFMEILHSDTYSLSYIGRLDMGIYEQYIEEIHTYSSGTPGLSIEMIALEDAFYLDIMQSFKTSNYIDAFVKELTELGIPVYGSMKKRIKTPNSSF
ncbi:hypothetical protein [Enterococcus hermanniensis]|uniref:Condensation domain-containing protein n=1 Tax=Enterococcus hermanniensis TaxID=249189 RepID=A0A1L8TQS4_9ENTE|nr:hypothetical protein [Enterococcus hermanniensis]OJG46666.1 hypothetical protein RV04_GL001094 [Enterococcus hermanniensis]